MTMLILTSPDPFGITIINAPAVELFNESPDMVKHVKFDVHVLRYR